MSTCINFGDTLATVGYWQFLTETFQGTSSKTIKKFQHKGSERNCYKSKLQPFSQAV